MLIIVEKVAAIKIGWIKQGNIDTDNGLCGYVITTEGGLIETDLSYMRLEAALKLALVVKAKTINTLNPEELRRL